MSPSATAVTCSRHPNSHRDIFQNHSVRAHEQSIEFGEMVDQQKTDSWLYRDSIQTVATTTILLLVATAVVGTVVVNIIVVRLLVRYSSVDNLQKFRYVDIAVDRSWLALSFYLPRITVTQDVATGSSRLKHYLESCSWCPLAPSTFCRCTMRCTRFDASTA